MIIIFAKHKTNFKVAIECNQNTVPTIQKKLHEEYGGNWVRVEDVKFGQGIVFQDENVYQGYSPQIEKYANVVKIY